MPIKVLPLLMKARLARDIASPIIRAAKSAGSVGKKEVPQRSGDWISSAIMLQRHEDREKAKEKALAPTEKAIEEVLEVTPQEEELVDEGEQDIDWMQDTYDPSDERVKQEVKSADTRYMVGQGLAAVIGVLGNAGAVGKYRQSPVAANLANSIAEITAKGRDSKVSRSVQEFAERVAAKLETDIQDVEARRLASTLTRSDAAKEVRSLRAAAQNQIRNARDFADLRTQRSGSLAVNLQNPPSDDRIKNIKFDGITAAKMLRSNELSDIDYKVLENMEPREVAKGILQLGRPYSGNELQFLHDLLDDDNQYGYDVHDAGEWRDDVLNGYMKHIKNYIYKYKPEALQVDSRIDPEEEHIGPMAQDIEEVNPACIEETPEGIKTVNTGRLSLMNAGAIAELAREVAELKRSL